MPAVFKPKRLDAGADERYLRVEGDDRPVRNPLSHTAMTFGDAIAALKKGERIARAGWNGKNMYLCHAPAQQGIVHIARNDDTQLRTFEPCVVMFTAQGTFQPGWLASQNDMLADDWNVLGVPL